MEKYTQKKTRLILPYQYCHTRTLPCVVAACAEDDTIGGAECVEAFEGAGDAVWDVFED